MKNRTVFGLYGNLLLFGGKESMYLPWSTVKRIRRIKRMDILKRAQRQGRKAPKQITSINKPIGNVPIAQQLQTMQAVQTIQRKGILNRIASMFPFFKKD